MRATVQLFTEIGDRPQFRAVAGVPREPRSEDGVSRMQFLLDLRQRGINDVAVLRALAEVPRERFVEGRFVREAYADRRSEEHTSELQSRGHLVCRLLLEKKTRSTSASP